MNQLLFLLLLPLQSISLPNPSVVALFVLRVVYKVILLANVTNFTNHSMGLSWHHDSGSPNSEMFYLLKILSNNSKYVEDLKGFLNSHFNLKDFGNQKYFLGL